MAITRRTAPPSFLLLIAAACTATAGDRQTSEQHQASYLTPTGDPDELAMAVLAKVLCSAVFVSGRDFDEAMANKGAFVWPNPFRRDGDPEAFITDTVLDLDDRAVRLTLNDTVTRTAKFYGDQGCIIHPPDHDGIFFDPVPVRTTLPEAMTQDWPMGDRIPDGAPRPNVNGELLDRAVEVAFAPEALTAAFVVVRGGHIIAERYMEGLDRNTQLESWSMGKSLTATLFGVLLHEGHFSLDDLAPVPRWRQPGDPRGGIRIRHLLNMSSGLRFIAPNDPDFSLDTGYPDHFFIYSGAINVAEYVTTRPVQWPPETYGRYRNSDPLTIAFLIQQAAEEMGVPHLAWPQRALFDRIGIRRQVLETDPYGNFISSGYDYGTGRNWARLGLLYLQGGVWQGERILPAEFVEFVRTPAPAWDPPIYGGFFWLNRGGQMNLPEDAYFMAGAGGQYTIIVPSLDMVVVRLGHGRGNAPGDEALNEALALLTRAVADPGS